MKTSTDIVVIFNLHRRSCVQLLLAKAVLVYAEGSFFKSPAYMSDHWLPKLIIKEMNIYVLVVAAAASSKTVHLLVQKGCFSYLWNSFWICQATIECHLLVLMPATLQCA